MFTYRYQIASFSSSSEPKKVRSGGVCSTGASFSLPHGAEQPMKRCLVAVASSQLMDKLQFFCKLKVYPRQVFIYFSQTEKEMSAFTKEKTPLL